MSKGYPDFFGFSIFPQHGQLIWYHPADEIVAGPTIDYEIGSISAKGEILCAQIRLGEEVANGHAVLSVYLDDEPLDNIICSYLGYEHWKISKNRALYYDTFDHLNKRWYVAIKPGVTFVNSLQVLVDVSAAGSIWADVNIWYYRLV